MASRFMSGALAGGRNTLDVPVAALAGLSVAFAAFAAPADLLSDLIGSSGVSAFIPAAEPPLGMNSRLAIGGGGAVLVFAIAFALLRWLDGFGSGRPEREVEPEPQFETPRLRRRDFHPDAAPRPPLFAASELGEPECGTAAALRSEPEHDEVPDPVSEPARKLELELEPQPQPQPEAEAPRPVMKSWLDEVAEPETEATRDVARERPKEAARPHSYTMAELLDRLEQGLARRRAGAQAQAAPASSPVREAAAAAQVFPEPADDRLQSAIDSLQRLAARHD